MKNRILAVVSLFVLSLNLAAPSLADTKGGVAAKSQAAQLVSILPASDAVAIFDARRFFGEAMPKILSGNQPLLSGISAKLDEIQSKSGIDLRQFESVTAGLSIKKISAKDYDFEPIVIARGQINAGALIAAAKLAANGKYREEKIGTRVVYVFSPKDLAARHKAKTADPKKSAAIDRVAEKLSSEMAVTAYDTNTVAFGTVARLRETLLGKTRVSPEIADFLGRSEGAFSEFAAKVPSGMSGLMPIENDELGKNIDSIRFLYGSMSNVGDATSVRAFARTMQAEQAQSLKETLEGLQMIGKAFLGSSKAADKQVYARLINSAKFAVNGNEVSFDLSIPQSDVDILVGSIK